MTILEEYGISPFKPVGEDPLAMRQEPEPIPWAKQKPAEWNRMHQHLMRVQHYFRTTKGLRYGFEPQADPKTKKLRWAKRVPVNLKAFVGFDEYSYGKIRPSTWDSRQKKWVKRPGKKATKLVWGPEMTKEEVNEWQRLGIVDREVAPMFDKMIAKMETRVAIPFMIAYLGVSGAYLLSDYNIFRTIKSVGLSKGVPPRLFSPQAIKQGMKDIAGRIPKYELGKTLGGGTTRLLEQPRGMAAYPEYTLRSMKGELVPRPHPISVGKEYKLSPDQSTKLGNWFSGWLSNRGLQIAPETQQAITKYTAFSAPSYQVAKHTVKDLSRMLTNPMTGEAARQAFMGIAASLPTQFGAVKIIEAQKPLEIKGTPELPDNTVELFGGLGAVAPSVLTAPLNQATKQLKNRLMEMFLKYESLRRISPEAARSFEGLEYGAFESKDAAVKFVGNLQGSFKLSNEQLPLLADVIELGKRQPAIYETAPQNVQDMARAIIEINEWAETELKKRPGIWPGKFPDAQIRMAEAKLATAQEKGNAADIEKYQAAIKELEDLRYLRHLIYTDKVPRNWLGSFVEKGLPKIKPSRERIGVGRKVPTTQMLRELKIPHEENPLVATGQYMWRAMTEMRKYDFLEGFKQDTDLVRQKDSKEAQDPDFRPIGGWIKGANLPQYKDYVVHKAFAQALAEYASPEEKTALGRKYDKLNRTLKQIKFYNFFIMTLNNLMQGLISGSMMPFHTRTGGLGAVPWGMTYKWAKDAWVMHTSGTEEYKEIEKLGLFSMPIPRESDVMHSLKAAFDQNTPEAKASKLWMERTFGIKIDEHFWSQWMKTGPVRIAAGAAVGGFAAGPFGAAVGGVMASFPKEFYHMNRHLTWTLDRLQRLMSYFKYRAEGKTMQEAVIKAKAVHADYDMLNKKTAMWLTRVLLTPKYKGAMLKMYKNMVVSFGSKGGRAEYMGADVPSFKDEARNWAAYMAVLLLGLSAGGFRLTQWYRATRETKDEEGKPKEEVHVLYGPPAELLKYLGRARVGQPISSMKDLQGRMATLVYPYTAVPVHAYWSWMRNRDWKGDAVYSEGTDFFKEQLPSTFAFLAREILAPLSQTEVMSEQDRTVKENWLNMFLITLYKRGEIQGYVKWKLRERAGQLRTTNDRDEKQGILTDERIRDREEDFDAFANKFIRDMMEYEHRQGANRWDLERMYGPVPHISEEAVAKRREELEKPTKRKKKKKPKKKQSILQELGISPYQ